MAGKWRNRTTKVLGAALLAAAVLAPSVALALTAFDDVPAGHPHEAGIQYVFDKGITKGCDADSYCPQDLLTRAQMATFLFRASGNDPLTPPSVNADTIDGLDSTALGGAPGPAGPPGVSGLETKQVNIGIGAAFATSLADQVSCTAGKKVLGGGVASTSDAWAVVQSAPSTAPSVPGWVGQVRRVTGSGGTTMVLYVICADVS